MPRLDLSRRLGFDLAGRKDTHLPKAAAWALAAAAADAVPYGVLAFALHAVMEGDPSQVPIPGVAATLLGLTLAAWYARAQTLRDSFLGTGGLVADARIRLADRLGRMPLGRVRECRGAALTELFGDRFSFYQAITTHLWWQVTGALGLPFLLWLALLMLDWRLALATLGFAPVAAAAVPWSFRLLDSAAAPVEAVRERLSTAVVALVEGAREIRLLDPAGQHDAAARAAVGALAAQALALEVRVAPAILAYGAIWIVAQGCITGLAALLWQGGEIEAFAFVLGLILSARCTAAVGELGVFLVEYRVADRILSSIRALADEPLQPTASVPRAPADASLELRDVSFSHGGELSVKDITLTIPTSSLTALVGPSGAGKSTLAALMARLWDPDRGLVLVGGTDIRQIAPVTLNAHVSMVLQDVDLFEMSVADNIRLGRPDATLAQVEAAARAARIHERIQQLPEGYACRIGGPGTSLSGGERQRIAIARALLKDAPILILDEATAGIDLDNERLIQEALEALCAGRTVIVIAHRLRTIAKADRIVVLNEGRIVETGDHQTLLARRGLYRSLLRSQDEAQA